MGPNVQRSILAPRRDVPTWAHELFVLSQPVNGRSEMPTAQGGKQWGSEPLGARVFREEDRQRPGADQIVERGPELGEFRHRHHAPSPGEEVLWHAGSAQDFRRADAEVVQYRRPGCTDWSLSRRGHVSPYPLGQRYLCGGRLPP